MLGDNIWASVESVAAKEEQQKQLNQYDLLCSLLSRRTFDAEIAKTVHDCDVSSLVQLYHDIRYANSDEDGAEITLGGEREWFVLDEFQFNVRAAETILLATRKKSTFL